MKYLKELKQLVEINSYTKNKEGVDKNLQIYLTKMIALGYDYEIFHRTEIGDHVLFRSPKREGKKLLLVGHMDTVFPKGVFEGYDEDDTWVYGPGVCDMKGGNIVAIEALRNIFYKYGKIENIDFWLVSDEEDGSNDSKNLTFELAKEYDYAIVYEAAGKDLEIVVGRKGAGTFEMYIDGKAAHAGNDYALGVDANLEASYKIQELKKLTDLKKDTTVNVGKIEGGIGANTISPFAKMVFEVRYTDTKERDRLLKEIDRIVSTSYVKGSKSTLKGGIQRDVFTPTKEQEKFIRKIENIVGKKLKKETRGGGSDANAIHSAGVAVIDGFGPFGDGDHTDKERALKSSFVERIELSTKIFEAFMDGKFNES
ncbi:MAG: M20 family metallopeptidase [Epsilonproteobacteria bacterium]|nr:M20 family metallopeptidase [Campylobacterota bacterium]